MLLCAHDFVLVYVSHIYITLDTFRNLAPARAAARPDKGLSSPVGEGVKRPEGKGGAGGGAGGGTWLEGGGGGPGGGGRPVGVSVVGRGGGGGGPGGGGTPAEVGVTVEPGGRGGGVGRVSTACAESVEKRKV